VSAARERILGAIRSGLRGTTVPALPAVVARTPPGGDDAAAFTAVLTRIGGKVEAIADRTALRARLAELLSAASVRTVALSDAPGLGELLPAGVTAVAAGAGREALFAADAGLTMAQLGIAETGTVVLASADEQHRLASLLPERHYVVLPRSRLCGTLAAALALLQAADGAPRSRTITFVTGPSRTADIELVLVVGVHGPKELCVLLLDGE
jgi:L-lactate dehydrogenase complex protein LldG